jgi:hypothetical protein
VSICALSHLVLREKLIGWKFGFRQTYERIAREAATTLKVIPLFFLYVGHRV